MRERLYKVHVKYGWHADDPARGIGEAARLHRQAMALLKERDAAQHFVKAYLNERDEPQGTMVVVLRDRDTALMLKLALA